MLLFLEAIAPLIAIPLILHLLLSWSAKRSRLLTNVIVMIAEAGAAYSISFVFDMILQVSMGRIPSANTIVPVCMWIALSLCCHLSAKQWAAKPYIIMLPYGVLGMLAILVSLVHRQNFLVGLLTIITGFLFASRVSSWTAKPTEQPDGKTHLEL